MQGELLWKQAFWVWAFKPKTSLGLLFFCNQKLSDRNLHFSPAGLWMWNWFAHMLLCKLMWIHLNCCVELLTWDWQSTNTKYLSIPGRLSKAHKDKEKEREREQQRDREQGINGKDERGKTDRGTDRDRDQRKRKHKESETDRWDTRQTVSSGRYVQNNPVNSGFCKWNLSTLLYLNWHLLQFEECNPKDVWCF